MKDIITLMKIPFVSSSRILSCIRTLILLFILHGCCEDEIVRSYRLNTFEKSLIPFHSSQKLTFIDEEGNIFFAHRGPKKVLIDTERSGPESCQLTEYEKETASIAFQSNDGREVLSIWLELTSYGTSFSLSGVKNSSSIEQFELGCDAVNLSIEERFTDVSMDQFDFKNVLIFQNCATSSEIERIIYSRVNGIEFIAFKNGKWLKLDEQES